MSEADGDNIFELLTAFADGELDTAATARVLDYLQSHPEAVRWMRDQQRLTMAVRATFDRPSLAASDEFKNRVRQAAASSPRPAAAFPRSMRISPWIRRAVAFTAAAAALLMAGIFVGHAFVPGRDLIAIHSPPNFPETASAEVIPAAIVSHASAIHDDCSRLAVGLHSAPYPQDAAALAGDVEQNLHSDHPYPNLSAIGFRYEGAGPCAKPLANTIHLLYRSMRPGSHHTVSVFVQRNTGQFPMATGRVYTVSVAQSPFPMLAWETQDVVYFLIADSQSTEQSALALIRSAQSTAATSAPAEHP